MERNNYEQNNRLRLLAVDDCLLLFYPFASEPEYIMLLLGMGVRTFSLASPMIPEIKQIIRSVELEDCNKVARKVISMNSERHISSYLRDAARKILPEAF